MVLNDVWNMSYSPLASLAESHHRESVCMVCVLRLLRHAMCALSGSGDICLSERDQRVGFKRVKWSGKFRQSAKVCLDRKETDGEEKEIQRGV